MQYLLNETEYKELTDGSKVDTYKKEIKELEEAITTLMGTVECRVTERSDRFNEKWLMMSLPLDKLPPIIRSMTPISKF